MRPLLAALVAALVLAPAAAAHVDNPKQIPFVWPAQGTITTPFGPQPDGRFHPGLDIGVLASLEVDVAAPGRVLAVGAVPGFEGYGNIVLVDVGNGMSACMRTSRRGRSSRATTSSPPSRSRLPGAPAGARERICISRCGWVRRRSTRSRCSRREAARMRTRRGG
jgi:hypothetical protein